MKNKPAVRQSATMEQIFPAFARLALLEPLPVLDLENANTDIRIQKMGDQHNTNERIPNTSAI